MTAGTACADRSGFLFSHACDRPALSQCAACGKSICAEHVRPSEEGFVCVTCLLTRHEKTPPKPKEAAKYADDPYWYAETYGDDYETYDVKDYRAFDEAPAAAGAAGALERDDLGS